MSEKKNHIIIIKYSFIIIFIASSYLFKEFIIGKPKKKLCNQIVHSNNKIQNLKNNIPILLGTNNNYSAPCLVAITSACENLKNYTKYTFYIIIDESVTEKYKNYFKLTSKIYPNCEIFLIDFPKNLYEKLPQNYRLPNPTFFRLFAPILLSNIEKIIYIDCDTLILKDLSDMYKINMKDYYILGFLDNDIKIASKYLKKIKKYICTGVTLMNLKRLREFDFAKEVIKFIKIHPEDSIGDQVAINILYQDHLGSFHPRYGSYNFYNEKEIKNFHSRFKENLQKNSIEELLDGVKNPTIVHLTHSPKPWDKIYYNSLWFNKNNNKSYKNLWWDYLYKTEICSDFYENHYMNGKKIFYSFLDYFKI